MAVKMCECGCGGTTKSRFVPGHDAKLKSRLLNAMRAGDEDAMDEMMRRGWLRGESNSSTGSFTYRMALNLPAEKEQSGDTALMEKVGKILALQAGAKTQGEAEAAAAMAQKLAFKHNLDLEAIRKNTQGIGNREFIRGYKAGVKSAVNWMQTLINVVARTNFCRVVTHTGSDAVSIVGERHNILVTDYMYEFLAYEINRLVDKGWATAKDNTWENVGVWKKSFRVGAVHGVHEVLERQRREDVVESGSMALVVVVDQEVENAMIEMFPDLKTAKTKQVRMNAGFFSGQAAGRQIQINKGVGNTAAKALRA